MRSVEPIERVAPAAKPLAAADGQRDAVRWFILAVSSLAVAGLLALVLVAGRVPAIGTTLIPDAEFARRSLVVHVNLAITVWFLAFIAGLFRLNRENGRSKTAPAALVLAVLGTILFTIPVVFPSATPVLSNYVPVLDNGMFLGGMGLFAAGILLNFADFRLFHGVGEASLIPEDAHYALIAVVPAFVIALITIAGAYVTQNEGMATAAYYERLFWGGGHVLQVVNTLGMLACWLILLYQLTGRTMIPPKPAVLLFALLLLPILPSPWLTFGDYSGHWFTRMMEFGLFPVATVILIWGTVTLWKHRARLTRSVLVSPVFIGLAASATMTVIGFLLGAMIAANTTLVPAHYHANIGAVTVAYMAVLLALLPKLGAAIPWPRLAAWQPLLFGLGQMVFVLGLAVAGVLGQSARKTYGIDQHVNSTSELVGLIIVGVGGMIALAGGTLFIAIVTSAALHARRRA